MMSTSGVLTSRLQIAGNTPQLITRLWYSEFSPAMLPSAQTAYFVSNTIDQYLIAEGLIFAGH